MQPIAVQRPVDDLDRGPRPEMASFGILSTGNRAGWTKDQLVGASDGATLPWRKAIGWQLLFEAEESGGNGVMAVALRSRIEEGMLS